MPSARIRANRIQCSSGRETSYLPMDVAVARARAGVLTLLTISGDDGFEILPFAAFLLSVAVGGCCAGDLLSFVQRGLLYFGAIHNDVICC